MGRSNSDRDLILRFGRTRDQKAFAELVHRWDRPVMGFLTKASGSVDAAEDLRQEVFVRLYRYGSTYNPEYAFSTWLFRIATNVLNTWRVRQGRRDENEVNPDGEAGDFEPIDFSPNPREAAALRETEDRVWGAIEELPAAERELLLLRLDLDFSYREIGEIQDVPETTVKSRFYKLMARLRRNLRQFEHVERTVPK